MTPEAGSWTMLWLLAFCWVSGENQLPCCGDTQPYDQVQGEEQRPPADSHGGVSGVGLPHPATHQRTAGPADIDSSLTMRLQARATWLSHLEWLTYRNCRIMLLL